MPKLRRYLKQSYANCRRAAAPHRHQLRASRVPVLQLGISGQGLSEQQLNDLSQNFLRPQLVTVAGAVVPYSYGGKQRQVMIDLNESLIQSKGLSPQDVLTSVQQQNLILPSGTAKIGPFEYDARANFSPKTIPELNDIPVKVVGKSTIYLRDVANSRAGYGAADCLARRLHRWSQIRQARRADDSGLQGRTASFLQGSRPMAACKSWRPGDPRKLVGDFW
jgi:multidrug efflux pump subunit AcrB